MSKINIFLAILFLGLVLTDVNAQFKTSEFQISSENDFYNPVVGDERFYTLGADLIYRHIPRDEVKQKNHFIRKFIPQMHYLIASYSFHLRSYTPGTYESEDTFQGIGIPFSGYVYGQYKINGRLPNNNNLELGANLGILGPIVHMGQVHDIFHNDTGEDQLGPNWDNQVTNRPAIHIIGRYLKPLVETSFMQINSESRASIGNIFTHVEQAGRIILGKYSEINNSSFYGNKLRNEYGMEMFITGAAGIRLAAINVPVHAKAEDEDADMIDSDRSLFNAAGFVSLGVNASVRSFTLAFNLYQYRGIIDKDFTSGHGSVTLAYAFRRFNHEGVIEGAANRKK